MVPPLLAPPQPNLIPMLPPPLRLQGRHPSEQHLIAVHITKHNPAITASKSPSTGPSPSTYLRKSTLQSIKTARTSLQDFIIVSIQLLIGTQRSQIAPLCHLSQLLLQLLLELYHLAMNGILFSLETLAPQ